jgi:hypothetical protein
MKRRTFLSGSLAALATLTGCGRVVPAPKTVEFEPVPGTDVAWKALDPRDVYPLYRLDTLVGVIEVEQRDYSAFEIPAIETTGDDPDEARRRRVVQRIRDSEWYKEAVAGKWGPWPWGPVK